MNRIPSWEVISNLGKSKTVKKSYFYFFLVPIVAKFLSKINSPVEVIIGEHKFTFLFELPFSWKLFFFSALCFSVGSLLYKIAAPKIIKKHKSLGDFLQEGKNFLHIINYMENLGLTDNWVKELGIDTAELKRTGGESIAKQEENKNTQKQLLLYNLVYRNLRDYNFSLSARLQAGKVLRPNEMRLVSNEDPLTIEAQYIEWSFWAVFQYANESKPLLRALTAIFYLVGLIMFMIIIFKNIITVIQM